MSRLCKWFKQCKRCKGRIRLPNRMHFWKRSKEGGVGGGRWGFIFNLKTYIADFGNSKQGFFFEYLKYMIEKSKFRVQGIFFQQLYWNEIKCMHFILSGPHTSLHKYNHAHYKNCNMIFQKWWGGVKGRLEFFQKIIQFGSQTLP